MSETSFILTIVKSMRGMSFKLVIDFTSEHFCIHLANCFVNQETVKNVEHSNIIPNKMHTFNEAQQEAKLK